MRRRRASAVFGADSMEIKATKLRGLARAPASTKIPLPKRHWKTRLLLPATILVMTTGLVVYTASDSLWPALSVNVVSVILKDTGTEAAAGTVVVQAPGWVEPDPFPMSVSALADGVVREVLVLEGDHVERDQVVVRLIDEDARISLDQANAMLEQRQAAVAIVRARLNEAQRNWDNPIELTRMLETAQAKLNEKRAELARWPFELAREEARAAYLEFDFNRVSKLVDDQAGGDFELVRAEQNHKAQQAEVEVIRHRKAILESQIDALEADYKAAAQDLELRIEHTRALAEADAAVQNAEASVKSASAMRDEAILRLKRMDIKSPTNGVVMTRLVEPGAKVILASDNTRSAQVLRLYKPDALQVRVDIPLVDAAKVGVGQGAEIIVDVLPDRIYTGQVSRVVHEADVQKNTLQVKVAITNPTAELKPEMLARARFLAITETSDASQTGNQAQLVFIPTSATVNLDGESFVWVADPATGTARRVPIETGHTMVDDWISVRTGLNPGDRVIVNPPTDITDGARISVREN